MRNQSRIWADVSIPALIHNYNIIQKAVGPAKILAVVKADGYGHGALEVARIFEKCGASYLGVATIDEGIELRDGGITAPILVFGRTAPVDMPLLFQYNITQTVYCLEYAKELSSAGEKLGADIRAHLKLDTGMSRLGFLCHDNLPMKELCEALSLPHIEYEGVFTHFAQSDEKDGEDYTHLQFARFRNALQKLEENGFTFAIRHCANSGAVLSYPETYLDMVRPGLILYGLTPDREIKGCCEGLIPAMTVSSAVSLVKRIPKGTPVGYGSTEITENEMTLATVSAGYADGYCTKLSHTGEVLIHGEKARIVGRVCMDQFMVDVTHIPDVKGGDRAVLFGAGAITADDVAEKCGLLNYEITCAVSKRVPRIYR